MGKEHKKYAWNLIAKKLAGDATSDELTALESLLRNNPELHYPMQTIADLWIHISAQDKEQAEKAFNEHVDRMTDLKIDYAPAPAGQSGEDPFPVRKRNYRPIAFFLAPAICLSIVLILYFNRSPKASVLPIATASPALAINTGSSVNTANGSRMHLSLPDGTKVWVNAGSRIDYGKNFGVTYREVELTGEAFFDVAPDAHKPFIVHTRGLDIRVLGTSFNVKSYPSETTSEATLIRGSIEVSLHNRPKDKIILKPNEKLVVSNDDSLLKAPTPRRREIKPESLLVISKPTVQRNTGAIIETSWVDNKLIFQEEEFTDLARQMERWYAVSIRFDDPKLEKLQFTGTFEKESIRQALDELRLVAKFDYSVEGQEITIHD